MDTNAASGQPVGSARNDRTVGGDLAVPCSAVPRPQLTADGKPSAQRNWHIKPALSVALAGFGAATAQVVVIRELLVASAGNELSIAAVLAAWLLWSAAGSWLGGRAISRSRLSALTHFTVIALIEVIAGFTALGMARGGLWALRALFGGALVAWKVIPPAGATPNLPQLMLLTTLVTVPVGLCLGWQFAAGCALLREGLSGGRGTDAAQGAARAYIADALGHLMGGTTLSVTAVTRLPAEAALTGGLVLVLVGVWLLRPTVARMVAGALFAAGTIAAMPLFRYYTLGLRWAPHKVTASFDGPVGNVTVVKTPGGELNFFINGTHALETGTAPAGEQWVHIPLLAHGRPKRIMLIGGGPRALGAALAHHPARVTYFELDPTVIFAIRQLAPAPVRDALHDKRVRVSVGDARLGLPALLRSSERFDVVLIGVGDPTTAQLNRYYTREWFSQVQGVLASGGLIGFQMLSSADYLTKELRAYNACMLRTAQAAGLKTIIFPGSHMTVLGSPERLSVDLFDNAAALENQIRSRGLDPVPLLASFYDSLDPFRRADRQRELDDTFNVRLNEDFTPTCYYYSQVLWASWWQGWPAAMLTYAQELRLWHVLGLIGLVTAMMVILSRVTRRASRVVAPYALLISGMGCMTLEVVLLIGLQTLYGYVYGMVGYVVGVLMAGLAVGAWWAYRHPVRPSYVSLAVPQAGLATAAGLSIAGLGGLHIVSHLFGGTGVLPVAVVSVLMGITGMAVGAAFPRAVALTRSESISSATALYATDLIGACVGALTTGLLLVPLLGVTATCMIVASCATGSALVCLVARHCDS